MGRVEISALKFMWIILYTTNTMNADREMDTIETATSYRTYTKRKYTVIVNI